MSGFDAIAVEVGDDQTCCGTAGGLSQDHAGAEERVETALHDSRLG